jgi:DNA invertase Pin-like site-specific DNA recombinase
MLIGYARVSTQDQNPQLQLDALQAAGCERVFVEKASGAQRDRPELLAALDYMRQGDALVVWKLDRLARSLKQLIETVEDLEARGIGFRSLTEAIDTTSAGGKLVFHIFAALAEFERGIIRERTRAGLDAARARGKVGGRPRSIGEVEIRQAQALLRDPEIRVADVAKRLGVSEATLYRHLPGGRAGVSPPSSGPSPTCCAATTSSPTTARSSCPSPCCAAWTACWSPPRPRCWPRTTRASEKRRPEPEPFLLRKAGQSFYNTSPLDLKKLMGDQDHIARTSTPTSRASRRRCATSSSASTSTPRSTGWPRPGCSTW